MTVMTPTQQERDIMRRRLAEADNVDTDRGANGALWKVAYGDDVRRLLDALVEAEDLAEREYREREAMQQIHRRMAERLHAMMERHKLTGEPGEGYEDTIGRALDAACEFVTDELRKEREHNGRLQRAAQAAKGYRDLAVRLRKKHDKHLDEWKALHRVDLHAADGRAANWRSHFATYGQHLKRCRCRDSEGWVEGKYGKGEHPDALMCDCGLSEVLALLRHVERARLAECR